MADFHVKTTGVASIGSGASASWDDADCYASIRTAYDEVTVGDNDNIIVDDGYYTETNLNTGIASLASGTINIKSRNSDASLITWDCDTAAQPLIKTNDAALDITISDITLTRSDLAAANMNGSVIEVNQAITLTLNDVVISNVSGTLSAVTDRGFLITANNGTVICNGLTVSDIDITTGKLLGLIYTNGTASLTGTDISFANITCSSTADFSCTALIRLGTGTNILTGDVTMENCHLIQLDTDKDGDGMIWTQSTTISNVFRDIIADNCTVTTQNGHCNGVVFYTGGVTTIRDVTANNCHHYYDSLPSGHADGHTHGVALSSFTGGVLTARRIKCTNCTGSKGIAFYAGQSGSATVESVEAYGNTAYAHGIIYLGGWGDVTINSALIRDNTITNVSMIDDPQYGGAFFVYRHPEATRSKTNTVNHLTLINNTITLPAAATYTVGAFHMRDGNEAITTYDTTLIVNNAIINNGMTEEVKSQGVIFGADFITSMDYCFVNGGYSAMDGIDTATNEVTGITFLSDGKIAYDDSDGRRGGKFIAFGSVDIRGRRRPVPPSVGAYEPTSGDPADIRTIRA